MRDREKMVGEITAKIREYIDKTGLNDDMVEILANDIFELFE